jgi:hypothetical protein
MKKLLLVMLVPVLVLGLFSCGKLLDAEMMPFELHGTWTGDANGMVMILVGNQATICADADDSLEPAAYRVEVIGSQDKDTKAIDDGTIKFVGFKDKKAAEIATAKFSFDGTDLTISEVTRADDAVSYLIPAADKYTK